jgi:5'-methylthioadenosine phosphorylase
MRVGVIGGSGLYQIEGLEDVREERVSTPFGEPSDALIHGRLGGAEVVFLPRHGRGHRYNPSEVNYRANIYALKSVGVEWIVSVSAVGSLREDIAPGDVVLVDQYVDRTIGRARTFFENGIVGHVGFGDPVCPTLRDMLLAAAREQTSRVHDGGAYLCMEGPQFSTRAESQAHRTLGCSVVGMTNMPEAKLAREAEISYAALAMATDYDCWHPHHDAVTVEQVVAVLHANADLAKSIVAGVVPRIVAHARPSPFRGILATSIMTAPAFVTTETRQRLAAIVGPYLPVEG